MRDIERGALLAYAHSAADVAHEGLEVRLPNLFADSVELLGSRKDIGPNAVVHALGLLDIATASLAATEAGEIRDCRSEDIKEVIQEATLVRALGQGRDYVGDIIKRYPVPSRAAVDLWTAICKDLDICPATTAHVATTFVNMIVRALELANNAQEVPHG